MADDHLAEELAVSEMAPTGLGVVEGKYAVDDRPDLALLHHPGQVLEITPAADRDRLAYRTLASY